MAGAGLRDEGVHGRPLPGMRYCSLVACTGPAAVDGASAVGGGGRTHGFLLRIYPCSSYRVCGVCSALAAGEQPTHPHSRGGGAKK